MNQEPKKLNVWDKANEDMTYKLPEDFEIKLEDPANTAEAEDNTGEKYELNVHFPTMLVSH